uniref:phosphotransferase-like protein n=1 Tax=Cephaloticoccus sp. TaxID=1985742 RepID=UPI00404B4DF6
MGSRWQKIEVHKPGLYDLEVDTARQRSETGAAMIRQHFDHGPPRSACQQLSM